jgi:hypothetical protein
MAAAHRRASLHVRRRCEMTTLSPTFNAPHQQEATAQKWEYLVVPLKEAKSLKKDDDFFMPEQLNELGEEGWDAVGLSLKYGDLMAWPVVLLKRSLV